jgi:hypothetical protein
VSEIVNLMSRQEAWELLSTRELSPSQIHHALESEAVLRRLAERLGEDVELWGLVGLLHDVDFDVTQTAPERHGLEGAALLACHLPDEAVQAIRAHNFEENHAEPPRSLLDWALRCGETVTGLVAATALMRPTGLSGMKPKSLKKKMKDRRFAANVRRDVIRECERLGLELEEFLQLSIEAMASIAGQIGLATDETRGSG